MANTYNEHNGTGSQDTFAYTFPYLKTTDVKVSVDGVVKQLTTDYTRPSVTTIQFNSDKKPANGAKVRIYRDTDESSANATFYAGSAIKSEDLNDNFLQAIYIGEEGKETADDAWNKLEDSVDSTETWVSNNTTISTTGAIDARVDSKIDTALTTDVAAGNKITVTDNSPGSGQITIGVTSGSLVNSDINASAAIAGTKISPDFGSQNIATTGTVDGRDVSADGTKLDGIEANATADQTNAEIRAAVEAASDSNVFTDADHSKLNAIEANATADQTASEIKTLLQSDKLTASEIANGTITSTQIATGALDGRYFTETESDARYFQISGSSTIGDGDTFPDNDTSIATTAAINDRIVDLLDDVGGFVPIANETSFPNANPDANNGAGTIVSIKALGSNVTSNGSGVATIANGTVGNSTVTINGLANSTTYAAGIGILVETTSTLNTYTFHRQVPNATEVSTVASKATEIGRLGTAAAVEDLSILGTTAVVADLAILGTTDVVADMNTLATSDVVSDMNTLAVTSVINNMDTCATNVSNINNVGGSISNVNTVASNMSTVNDFAARYRVASSAPSSSLDTGDLYFDTSANELKVYNGSTWQGGVTATGNFATLGANQFTGNITFSGSQTVDGRDVSADGTKLDGIAAGAEVNVQSDWDASSGDAQILNKPTIPGGATGLDVNDDVKVRFGTGNDLFIYHNGSNSYIENDTGNLIIDNGTGVDMYINSGNDIYIRPQAAENGIKVIGDGGVELYYDGSKKFFTHAGGSEFNNDLDGGDDCKLRLGSGQDLQLYHNGTHSYIVNTTGEFWIKTDGSQFYYNDWDNEYYAKFIANGAVELYYDGSKKFETQSAGVEISGKLTFANDGLANGSIDLGADADLNLYHDNSNAYIDNNTGDFYIRNAGSNPNQIYIQGKGGEHGIIVTGDSSVELYHNNVKKFETVAGGIKTNDGNYMGFGNGNDLQISHDGSNSLIDNSTGNLFLRSDNEIKLRNLVGSEDYLECTLNGSVRLYYDNVKKLETDAGGINVVDSDSTVEITLTDSGGAAGHIYGKQSDGLISILVSNGEYAVNAYQNGAVKLYYDNSEKLETTSSGVTVTGSVTDSKGNLRSIPSTNKSSSYTLTASDAGTLIYTTGGGVTINDNVMSGDEAVTIVNNSGSDQTITQGSGFTLYNTADGSTGNRTLAGRGMATIWYSSAGQAYITGSGLS